MKLAAFVFCIIGICATGWCLIPLLWEIPMTIAVYYAYRDGGELSLGFKIAVLLLFSPIAGILLLCDKD